MALTLRPLSRSMTLCYAHDPAFDLGRAGYMAEYERCVETLDFAPVTLPGQTPTRFTFRPLRTSELLRFPSLGAAGGMALWLTFRLCLEKVEGAGELDKLERRVDPEYATLGPIVVPEQMDKFDRASYDLGQELGDMVIRLGEIVFNRSRVPSRP